MRERLVLLAVAATSCAPLEPIPENLCGNQVLERDRGEDCDTFPASTEQAPAGVSLACGAATDARACLYICDPDGAGPGCPAGWACSINTQTCQRPALSFTAAAPITFSLAPEEVAFADFDGSGLHDLAFFSGSDVAIRYATGGGGFGPEMIDALSLAGVGRNFGFGAAVGLLDGDTIADIVAPTPGGALVLRGNTGQSLSAVPYPASTFSLPSAVGADVGVVALRAAGRSQALVVLVGEYDGLGPRRRETLIFPAEADLDPLSGLRIETSDQPGARVVAVADVDGDGGSELAIGYAGSDVVVWAAVRGRGDAARLVALPQHTMRLPAPVDDVIALSDLDADGHPDLIAEVLVGTELGIAIAMYRPRNDAFDAPRVFLGNSVARIQGAGLLAVADFNHDQRADLVISGALGDDGNTVVGAVITSTGTAGGYVTIPLASRQLREAVVADFNRDGNLDIAGTTDLPGVAVLLGSGTGVFNPGRVDSTTPVHTLRVGDFDGDFVPDLLFAKEAESVFVTPDANLGADLVRLSVAFGRVQGLPSAPVAMADTPRPISITPAYFIDPDLISDVVMLTHAPSEAEDAPGLARYSFYAFRGDSDRRLRSTLGIAGAGEAIAGVWMGNFDDAPGTDLVAFTLPTFGADGRLRLPPLWGITGEVLAAGGAEAGHNLDVGLSCAADLVRNEVLSSGFVARLALDDEAQPAAPIRRDLLVRFLPNAEALAAHELALSIIDLRLESGSGDCTDERLPSLGFGAVTRAVVSDVDGDAETDLLLVQDGPSDGSSNAVTLRWSARRSRNGRKIRTGDSAVIRGPVGDPIVDVAVRDVDADGRVDVVVATSFAVYLARQTGPRVFTELEPVGGDLQVGVLGGVPVTGVRPDPATEPSPLVRALVRVFAEDFDGDRLVDLLLVRGQTVQAFRGNAVPPGGGRDTDEPTTDGVLAP